MDYFYAGQLRQYRLQFIRAFSNFYVNFGTDDAPDLRRVPCRYGDVSRIAASVIQGNSENKILSTPFISCMITGLAMSAGRRQDPSLVEKVQVNERLYDEEIQRYTQDQGQKYTVERYMPVPYDLTMQVDIWTSNLNQKEQLIEQIFMLYNPAIDFQTSTNPLDWTFLSYIEMQDSITWSSRSIPVGTDNPIDVLTVSFKIPIWINPPAKVKRQSIIQQIVTNIIQGTKDPSDWEWTEYEFLSRTITTPGNYSISLNYTGGMTYDVKLLSRSGNPVDDQSLPTITASSINPTLVPGTSFVFNGITLPINTSSISTFVDDIHMLLSNTPYSVQLHNKNRLWFINNNGSDNVFAEGTGNPLMSLGLEATVYPGGNLAWWRLFEAYGTLKDYNELGSNASQLRVKLASDLEDDSQDVSGWISMHPIDQNRIIWTLDPQSIPPLTLTPINAIIDPQAKGPNYGLAAPALGQRYLLTNTPSTTNNAWGNLIANPNDIIEFTGNGWEVVFDSVNNSNAVEYVTNLFSGKIYKWSAGHWTLWIEQIYAPGYWRLSL